LTVTVLVRLCLVSDKRAVVGLVADAVVVVVVVTQVARLV